MANKKEELSIEEKLDKLNKLVDKLENEKMTLKESLSLYEEAMVYSKEIEKELSLALDKVKTIQEEK
jgi:exodeoxyribonuclease VII small subunit